MNELEETVHEVVAAIIPMAVVILVLMVLFLQPTAGDLIHFVLGGLMTVGGLGLFLLGARMGILPIGERLGSRLPEQGSLALLIGFGMLLGFAVTVAEPDVRVLTRQIEGAAPAYAAQQQLILTVAVGLGLFLGLAMYRAVSDYAISTFLVPGYVLIGVLAWLAPPETFAIAFDLGGVTTGPLAMPFILALNVGLAGVLGTKGTVSDSFGSIAIASIGPVVGVLTFGILLDHGVF